MHKFLIKLRKNRAILPIAVIVIALFLPKMAQASPNTSLYFQIFTIGFGKIVEIYVNAIGKLSIMMVSFVIKVAQYNDFVNSPAIIQGWTIMRDVVNMFFIVILLVIAFGTIFNIEEYKYQRLLPRLLIMAVVINFSRTIAGIFIDFGQVVMLTFVNGFQAAAGGNFVNALQINNLLNLTFATGETAEAAKLIAGFVLAAIMITVTLVVLVVMLYVLIMRVVILWFLVVLSPLAFLASVLPSQKIKANYAKWWDMFLDNIIVGPVLAFFLWLSLLVIGDGKGGPSTFSQGNSIDVSKLSAGSTLAFTGDNLLSYVLGIGMLVGSLYMAQSMRAAGAGFAGSALGKIKNTVSGAVRKPFTLAGKATKFGARTAAGAAWEGSGARAYKDALIAKVQSSKVGRLVGLGGKEYKVGQKSLRDEKALRNLGMKNKADALRTKLVVGEQKNLSEKGLTNIQLFKKYQGAKSGSVEKESIAREMADRNIIRNDEFKKYAEGNKRAEFALRSTAFRAGNKEAFVGYQEDETKASNPKKDIEDIYHREYTTSGQRQKMFTNIKEGTMLDKDGKMGQAYALEKLATLERDDFKDFNGAVKDKIKDSFVYARLNDENKFKQLGLDKKYKEITGEDFTDTVNPSTGKIVPGFYSQNKDKLLNEQTLARSQSRLEASQAGTLEKSDQDKAVVDSFSQLKKIEGKSGVDWQKTTLNDLYKNLNKIASAKGAVEVTDVSLDLEDIEKELVKKANKLDSEVIAGNAKSTGQYDKNGTELTHTALLKNSQFYKGLEDARAMADKISTSGKVTPEERKSVAAALNVSIRDMEEATFKSKASSENTVIDKNARIERTVDYKKAEAAGLTKLNDVLNISTTEKRLEALNQALFKLTNALNVVEKNKSAFSSPVITSAEDLKAEIDKVRVLGAQVGQSEVDKLKEDFEALRSKL